MIKPSPEEASPPINVTQKRGGWVRQWIDYPTIFIAFSGVALWSLWPKLPVTDTDRIPRRQALVVARDRTADPGDWHKRPDLIAFPSLVSFAPMAGGDDAATGVEYHSEGQVHLLERSRGADGTVAAPSVVALAAEAAREISSARTPRLHAPRGAKRSKRSEAPVTVNVSAGLGRVVPRWSATDEAVLFTLGRAWEVELSLTIADDGRPESVFVERGCGDSAIDRAVMRTLSRPDVWKGATEGSGTVLVSFAPRTANGEENEN
jgi:hypothetical protein